MKKTITNFIDYLERLGFTEHWAQIIEITVYIILITLFTLLADYITKKILLNTVAKLIKRTKADWDDLLIKRRVFHRLAHFAPAIAVYHLVDIAFGNLMVVKEESVLVNFIQSATYIYMIIIGIFLIDAVINTSHDVYQKLPIAANRPIKGYMQLVKIFIYFISGILILSIILDKNPKNLLTGLGALAAVLLLVFKDTILGFVASIQLSANNMVKPGDWIEMPKYNADGTVEEITLNTVKVRNWDKTVSTIPTYALVSESFYNWKGMEESGGRRIKRSINIDMKSVKFCDKKLIEKLRKIQLLKPYIDERLKEIDEYNKGHDVDTSSIVNGRWITNLGTFRKYIEAYLKQHPKIHNDMTFLVRHLQPSEKGIPIEIYVFSNDLKWANYEAIQADIFDHILAVAPEFELRVFQNPTGDDFQKLLH